MKNNNKIKTTKTIPLTHSALSQKISQLKSIQNGDNQFPHTLRNHLGTNTKNKIFIHQTRPYGNYFDVGIQKGGQSKII